MNWNRVYTGACALAIAGAAVKSALDGNFDAAGLEGGFSSLVGTLSYYMK